MYLLFADLILTDLIVTLQLLLLLRITKNLKNRSELEPEYEPKENEDRTDKERSKHSQRKSTSITRHS